MRLCWDTSKLGPPCCRSPITSEHIASFQTHPASLSQRPGNVLCNLSPTTEGAAWRGSRDSCFRRAIQNTAWTKIQRLQEQNVLWSMQPIQQGRSVSSSYAPRHENCLVGKEIRFTVSFWAKIRGISTKNVIICLCDDAATLFHTIRTQPYICNRYTQKKGGKKNHSTTAS